MKDEFSEVEGERLLRTCGHLYHACSSCLHPMLGIIKHSPQNIHNERVAREICFICERIEEEQARFEKNGTLA
jgi:hypothetical protein